MSPPDFHRPLVIEETEVMIRTIRPGDREIEADFVRNLSPDSRYLRFHGNVSELRPDLLERFINPDYPDEMALIATISPSDKEVQIGVGRYARLAETNDAAEIAIAVADDWQGHGVGRNLLSDLIPIAREAGIQQFVARVLPGNHRMRRLAAYLGFQLLPPDPEEGVIELGKGIESDGDAVD